MSKIKTFKGQLAMGLQEKIHLSTADGLTGYKIKKFQIISKTPGADADVAFVAQIFLTDQTGSITANVDFNNADLIGVCFYNAEQNAARQYETIIFDQETFNQDIFINITDADGGTKRCNYYLELEQFKINVNESTFATLKNLRSNQQL
jgi:hypothetical protein